MHTFAYMAFYKSISEHYDDIFPHNPMQVQFVRTTFEHCGDMKLLDVGCGTANLCIALAPHFKEVAGFDPDETMLRLANEKAGADHSNLSFHPYGMSDLDKQDRFCDMDAVLCFGNTLVHLADKNEIFQFLKQARVILKPGGELLMQVINYDWIFEQKAGGLPTIENDRIKFVRNYHFHSHGNQIDFETILTIKQSREEIRNSIPLFPVRKDEINELLRQAGFERIKFYGNFKRDPLQEDSIPLIIEATK